MKHLESIVFAAFVGGVLGFVYNEIWKFTDDKTTAIQAGAAIGASLQIVMRVTGVS